MKTAAAPLPLWRTPIALGVLFAIDFGLLRDLPPEGFPHPPDPGMSIQDVLQRLDEVYARHPLPKLTGHQA